MARLAEDERFWPFSDVFRSLSAQGGFPSLAQLDALYAERATRSVPRLRFVPDDKPGGRRRPRRPAALRYDGRIALAGEVPTRVANWHDLLNALCFTTFPQAKAALHRRQYELLVERDPGGGQPWPNARTREQDALTLFDEGGIAIACRDGATQLAFEAQSAMGEQLLLDACASGRVRLVPFGHALLEHIVRGESCPQGSVQVIPVRCALGDDRELVREIDRALALRLNDPACFAAPSSAGLRLRLPDAGHRTP